MPCMGRRFADKMATALAEQGLKPYGLWQASGVKQGQLSRYLNGHQTPEDKTIERLAPFLGLPLDDLIHAARLDRVDEEMAERVASQDAEIQRLRAEVAMLRGQQLGAVTIAEEKPDLPEAFTKRRDEKLAQDAKEREERQAKRREARESNGAPYRLDVNRLSAGKGIPLVDPDHRTYDEIDKPFSED
jgi:transcriptional regulator with XRE-family HTH domain